MVHGAGATVASVCNGAFLLAQSGLLARRSATTHWEDIEELKRISPSTIIVLHVPFVDEGAILSSAGIAAGISMCCIWSKDLPARSWRIEPPARWNSPGPDKGLRNSSDAMWRTRRSTRFQLGNSRLQLPDLVIFRFQKIVQLVSTVLSRDVLRTVWIPGLDLE